MRTTLNIDDELLAATRDLARQQGLPTGVVVSRLLRQALVGDVERTHGGAGERCGVAGFRPFPAAEQSVDNETIDRLRDEAGA